MTTGLTNAAMLVVMLLHAGFGCCWHHSHAVGRSSKAVTPVQAACCCGHVHGNGTSPGAPSSPDEEPAPVGPAGCECSEGQCRFLTASPVEAPQAVFVWCGASPLEIPAILDALRSTRLSRLDDGAAGRQSLSRTLARLGVCQV